MLTTLELSAIQAERLKALAKRAHMPVLEIVDLMLEVMGLGVDASRGSLNGIVTVESVIRELQKNHSNIPPDPASLTLPRNIIEGIQRQAARRASVQDGVPRRGV